MAGGKRSMGSTLTLLVLYGGHGDRDRVDEWNDNSKLLRASRRFTR
jgi:hypothetical protein